MAQKIIIFEGEYNKDILTDDRVAGLIAKGYSIKSVSAATVPGRQPTCYLLLENDGGSDGGSGGGSGDTVDASNVSVSGNWLNDYDWILAAPDIPLNGLLQVMAGVIDSMLTKVEGRFVDSSFYAVQSRDGDTITYKEAAETPAAGKLYIDITDGPKLYRYDVTSSSYVQIAVVREIEDDPNFDPWTP